MNNQMSNPTQTLKISKATIDILKNFSTINSSIHVPGGNTLYTISATSNIVAETKIAEEFPSKFSIYDMSQFLGSLSMFQEPEFEFEEKCVWIYDQNGSKIKFFFCEEKLLPQMKHHGKKPAKANTVIKFDISGKQLSDLFRISSVLNVTDININFTGEKLELVVKDKQNTSSNSYTIDIKNYTEVDVPKGFSPHMNVNNLKVVPGDYGVEIGENNVAIFKNKNIDLTYWIALEINTN